MTMFSTTASPGQRWKMFLPDAASIQGDVLSVIAASALLRNRWLSERGRPPAQAIAALRDERRQ
jgi:hypothetical protein